MAYRRRISPVCAFSAVLYDAVLVGANTIAIDDPQLNVRHVEGRNPKRIIIDGKLSCPPEAKVFNDENKANTILVTSLDADELKLKIFEEKEVVIYILPSDADRKISFKEVLKKLGKEENRFRIC